MKNVETIPYYLLPTDKRLEDFHSPSNPSKPLTNGNEQIAQGLMRKTFNHTFFVMKTGTGSCTTPGVSSGIILNAVTVSLHPSGKIVVVIVAVAYSTSVFTTVLVTNPVVFWTNVASASSSPPAPPLPPAPPSLPPIPTVNVSAAVCCGHE